MTRSNLRMFAAVIAVGALCGVARADTLTPSVAEPLTSAQEALKHEDFATALTRIHEAQSMSGRTAFDDYTINQFLARAAIGTKDYATALTAFEAMVESPAMPSADKKQTLTNIVIIAYNAQKPDAVITYAEQLQAMGPLDSKVAGPLAVTYYNAGQTDKAIAIAKAEVAAANAAGRKPEEALLNIAARADMKQGGGNGSLETLAQSYGEPEAWAQLLDAAFAGGGIDDRTALNLYRLRIVTGAISSADDYDMMGKIALGLGNPGEAAVMLQQGVAKGQVTGGGGAQLSQAKTKAAASKAGLAAQAAAAKTGADALKVAELYYGFGDDANAEQAANRALTLGGGNAAEAHQVLGMAQAREGKNAEAAATFAQVKGTPADARVAHLWSLYATRKY